MDVTQKLLYEAVQTSRRTVFVSSVEATAVPSLTLSFKLVMLLTWVCSVGGPAGKLIAVMPMGGRSDGTKHG